MTEDAALGEAAQQSDESQYAQQLREWQARLVTASQGRLVGPSVLPSFPPPAVPLHEPQASHSEPTAEDRGRGGGRGGSRGGGRGSLGRGGTTDGAAVLRTRQCSVAGLGRLRDSAVVEGLAVDVPSGKAEKEWRREEEEGAGGTSAEGRDGEAAGAEAAATDQEHVYHNGTPLQKRGRGGGEVLVKRTSTGIVRSFPQYSAAAHGESSKLAPAMKF